MLLLVLAAALAAGPAETPDALVQARRLAADLRFEEAVVEYQRYLGDQNRPSRERAEALLEVGFIHQLLEDPVNAERRALEALELEPSLSLPPDAPAKEVAFLERERALWSSRPKLELVPRSPSDAPSVVKARLADPAHRVRQVLLRHASASSGPFYGSPIRCEGQSCEGELPPPRGAAQSGATQFTAWYFLEATDLEGNTVARAASPSNPVELVVREEDPWFRHPWVWAGGAALLVGIVGVVFVAVAASGQ